MLNISLYNTIASQYRYLHHVHTLREMSLVSHHIEQQILQYQMPVEFYAGFQRFSSFLPQINRYTCLAQSCSLIYVFGVADIQPPTIPGIRFIELLPDTMMSHEWFLLVDTPEFWTLLSTYQIGERDQNTGQRCFEGIWTFDAPIVESASQLIKGALEEMSPLSQERYPILQNQNVTEMTQRLHKRNA